MSEVVLDTTVKCPNCGTEKEYYGTLPERVRCPNLECSRNKSRFYTKNNIVIVVPDIGTVEEEPPRVDYNNIPEKVVTYAKDISFESDDIRYFLKKIKGKSFRGNDMDAYDELLFYLHQFRPKYREKWLKRRIKRGEDHE